MQGGHASWRSSRATPEKIEGVSVAGIVDGQLGRADELVISPNDLRLVAFVMKSGVFSQR